MTVAPGARGRPWTRRRAAGTTGWTRRRRPRDAPGPRSAPRRLVVGHAATGSRSSGSSTSRARAAPTRYSEPATTTGPSPVASARSSARRRGRGPRRGRRARARAARHAAASSAAGSARGSVDGRAHDGRADERRAEPRSRARIEGTSLSAIDAQTRTGERRAAGPGEVRARGPRAPGRGRRRRRGCARRRAAPPGRSDVDELEAARPARASRTRAGGRPPGTVAMPGRLEGVEQRVGDRDVRRLVPAAQGDVRRSEPGQLDPLGVAVPAEHGRRAGDGERDAQPRAAPADRPRGRRRSRRSRRRRRARRSRPSPARSPSTVGPRRSVWSRPTLVSTATPPSQACVASRRPPRPTSTRATSSPASREVAEHHGGQELELRRRRRGAARSGRRAAAPPDEARERRGVDRPPVDHDPLAVRDEVRLGRLADAVAGGAQAPTRRAR